MKDLFNTLTNREREIFHLVIDGRSNPQIADQLYIARSTVETHRKNIHRKLGTGSRYELVMLGIHLGCFDGG